jgi:iron complex transport system ATP-binding protein
MKLRAQDLAFTYGYETVLDGVSLDVPEGTLIGLVGPNGAGKSTLLKCMYGGLRPRRGRVVVDGVDIATLHPAEIARILAVVPQSCSPAFPVSVGYFVGMGRFAREPFLGGPTEKDREVVHRCLAEMGLSACARRPVDELSGGEFRRVLIAQALAQEPQVLLFDEPVQQLDLLHQLEVMGFARAFTKRGGTAGVIVLHDLGLAARYCDTIALLDRGRIVASGRPDDVLSVEHLRRVYGVEVSIQRCPATGTIQVVPLGPALSNGGGPGYMPPSSADGP